MPVVFIDSLFGLSANANNANNVWNVNSNGNFNNNNFNNDNNYGVRPIFYYVRPKIFIKLSVILLIEINVYNEKMKYFYRY